ncbi:MAG: nucleotidyltransferase domain-containing protein [Candidatus Aquicultorales bacterium]
MLERLFSSRIRVEILGRTLLHPERAHHVRELERLIGPGSYRTVWKELKNLETLGVLVSQRAGRTIQYRANTGSSLTLILTELFQKNWAVADLVAEALAHVDGIKVGFVYGSFASGKLTSKSDLDLIIIGNPNLDLLDEGLADVEQKLEREVSFRAFTPEAWQETLKEGSPFIREVLDGLKLFLIGNENELAKLAR